MLPARRVCASRTRGSAHTWLRAADICQHDAPTLMGSTGRKPNNDRLADGTGDGGRRRVASEPVELPGSGSAARPLAEGDRQEPVTVVAQVWVSLEEGLLVGPSKTDYPLEVFVQETRPVPPGSSTSCGARPCAPYLAVGGRGHSVRCWRRLLRLSTRAERSAWTVAGGLIGYVGDRS